MQDPSSKKKTKNSPLDTLPVTVELEVAWHLSVRHGVRRLLQAQSLKVNTNAAVRDDEVWIHGALHPSGVLAEKKTVKHCDKKVPRGHSDCVQCDPGRLYTHVLHLRGRA